VCVCALLITFINFNELIYSGKLEGHQRPTTYLNIGCVYNNYSVNFLGEAFSKWISH